MHKKIQPKLILPKFNKTVAPCYMFLIGICLKRVELLGFLFDTGADGNVKLKDRRDFFLIDNKQI